MIDVDTIALEVNEGRRPCPPLPLPQVLANVQTLHVKCVGGGHVCGLRGTAVKFDLYRDFILPLRAYRSRCRR
jgi:hypothetical protein